MPPITSMPTMAPAYIAAFTKSCTQGAVMMDCKPPLPKRSLSSGHLRTSRARFSPSIRNSVDMALGRTVPDSRLFNPGRLQLKGGHTGPNMGCKCASNHSTRTPCPHRAHGEAPSGHRWHEIRRHSARRSLWHRACTYRSASLSECLRQAAV